MGNFFSYIKKSYFLPAQETITYLSIGIGLYPFGVLEAKAEVGIKDVATLPAKTTAAVLSRSRRLSSAILWRGESDSIFMCDPKLIIGNDFYLKNQLFSQVYVFLY